jgi:hypothetical protein
VDGVPVVRLGKVTAGTGTGGLDFCRLAPSEYERGFLGLPIGSQMETLTNPEYVRDTCNFSPQ